jgi:hypothetical protein
VRCAFNSAGALNAWIKVASAQLVSFVELLLMGDSAAQSIGANGDCLVVFTALFGNLSGVHGYLS